MRVTNQVDSDWFIDYPKAQRFIEDSGIRAETLKHFYKEKGIYYDNSKKGNDR